MVYYYTSKNIKLMRDIMQDYETLSEISPQEYMKTYVESCPQNVKDSKISWIIESFLGIRKHIKFLQEITAQIAANLSEEDKDYLTIIFYAIISQLTPKDMPALYKSIFNLSKPLLDTFTNYFSNIEILPMISQVGQIEYDTIFVTENIIDPLFSWQPYIIKMSQYFKEHLTKIQIRNLKKPTVPINPTVLSRTCKVKNNSASRNSIPDTPPNSLHNKKSKMLTNSKINQNLKQMHDKNKQNAIHLYNIVKNNNHHYAQSNIKKDCNNTISKEHDSEIERKRSIPMKAIDPPPEVKTTVATIKRINERVKQFQQEELKWFQDLFDNCRNTQKIDELLKYDRQEKEKERILDIERKHLMGQISYEEAVIAKKKLYSDNKKKYENFLKEKELWEKEIDKWKTRQIENNRKQVEKLSLIELDVICARNNMCMKKKEMAEKLRQKNEENKMLSLKNKEAELDRKANMIKEIKILAMISKKARIPKIFDLTESSGLGLLCEMSIAELQEKITVMKIDLKEKLDEKRNKIKTFHLERKHDFEETKAAIDVFMSERAKLRKEKASKIKTDIISPNNELNRLKNILEERRNLRMTLTKRECALISSE